MKNLFALLCFLLAFSTLHAQSDWPYPLDLYDLNRAPSDILGVNHQVRCGEVEYFQSENEIFAFKGAALQRVYQGGFSIQLYDVLGHGLLFKVDNSNESDGLYYVDNESFSVTYLTDLSVNKAVRIGDVAVFSYGDSMLVTDGTSGGTFTLAEFGFLRKDFSITIGNALIFEADGAMWRTDGTPAGTYELNDGPYPLVYDQDYLVAQDYVYYSVSGPQSEDQLWRTDGTTAEFVRSLPGSPSDFAEVPGGVVFFLSEHSNERELWVTDGTEAGTSLLQTFYAGSGAGKGGQITADEDSSVYFFRAGDDDSLNQLWKTDGTEAGTVMLYDFEQEADYQPGWSVGDVMEGQEAYLFFSTNHLFSNPGNLLWRYSIAQESLEPVMRMDYELGNGDFHRGDSVSFLFERESTGVYNLWRLAEPSGDTTLLGQYPGFIRQPFLQDNKLYFLARASVANSHLEPFASDGTPDGTMRLMIDGIGSGNGCDCGAFFELSDTLYFSAVDQEWGLSLYTSQGNESSTQLVADFRPDNRGSYISAVKEVAGHIFVAAGGHDDTLHVISESNPPELINLGVPVYTELYHLAELNGRVLFFSKGGEIYTTDGTIAGTEQLAEEYNNWRALFYGLPVIGDKAYFFSSQSGEPALWATDGTPEGTAVAISFSENMMYNSSNRSLAGNGSYLLFEAEDSSGDLALWRSDGTVEGTEIVKKIYPNGAAGSAFRNAEALGNKIIFSYQLDGDYACWVSDGTEAGTFELGTFNIRHMVQSGGEVYMTAQDGLYKTDGTVEGTVKLSSDNPGIAPTYLEAYKGGVVFAAPNVDNNSQQDLWVSDGTIAGTQSIQTLEPDVFFYEIDQISVVGEYAFVKTNPMESLWVTDGTLSGTYKLDTLLHAIQEVSFLNSESSRLYFIAVNNTYGKEVHYFEFDRPPLIFGTAFYDQNGNAVQDSLEPGIPNLTALAEAGYPNYSFTDDLGYFEFYARSGGTYNLQMLQNECWELVTTPEVYEVTAEATNNESYNFGYRKLDGPPNLSIDLQSAPIRCGSKVPFWAYIRNTGCDTAFVDLQIQGGPFIELLSFDTTELSFSGEELLWTLELPPSQSAKTELLYRMPAGEHAGDSIRLTGISNLQTDTGIEVDTVIYHSLISCTIDPNDKRVLPFRPEQTNSNYTLADETLYYNIRFQNIGTDTAYTVRIKDLLSPALDWDSFEPLSASHDYRVNVSSIGELTFLFEDILLPDSTVNEPESHGYVSFQIKIKEGVESFTEIENTAYIYFDYYSAMVTNTVISTAVEYLDFDQDGFYFWEECDDTDAGINPDAEDIPGNGIDENCDGEDSPTNVDEPNLPKVKLYPNPTIGQVYLKTARSQTYTLHLYDSSGRIVLQMGPMPGGEQQIDLSSLANGNYYFHLRFPDSPIPVVLEVTKFTQ